MNLPVANVEVTNLNIRQLESSSESLQPQASTQTSERDSNLDSDSTSSGLYTSTTSDTGERDTSDNLNNAGESGELSEEEDQRPNLPCGLETANSTETMEEYEARTADCCEVGKGCCALRILEAEEDFRNEISLLEMIIHAAGHEVIFYPKFHCEFNYIEYYWGALKRYTRDNCKYSFAELEPT